MNWMREELGKYQNKADCAACDGHRLKPEALCVKLDGKHIGEVTALPIDKSLEWFQKLPKKLTKKQNQIADKILREILVRKMTCIFPQFKYYRANQPPYRNLAVGT